MHKIKRFLLFSVLSIFFISCVSTAPLTGRSQLKLVSDESMVASSSESYHKFIQEAKSKGLLANQTREGKRVAKIGRKIAVAVEKYMIQNGMKDKIQYLQWEFNLIRSEEINAFAMPGGKIAFYTGILPILKTDSGIAFVMGHEIGHVIAGHHAEGYSHRQVVGITSALTEIFLGSGVNSLVSDGLSLGLLKFNRTQEYEADKYGMIFMAMAGYHPQEAIKTEQRMEAVAKQKGKSGYDFFSTHPAGHKRIQALQNFLPEAMKYYQK